MNAMIGDMEFQCANCKVRLDPLMTKRETAYFLTNGCIMCHENAWRLVPPKYDHAEMVLAKPLSDDPVLDRDLQYAHMVGEEE